VLTKFALKRAFGEDLNQPLSYGDAQVFDLTAVNARFGWLALGEVGRDLLKPCDGSPTVLGSAWTC
jgi:hypothetical protein